METSLILVTFRHLRVNCGVDLRHDRGENQGCNGHQGERCFIYVIVHTHGYSIADATPPRVESKAETR